MTTGLDRSTTVGAVAACNRGQTRSTISDLDIWPAANLLTRKHGEDAEPEAAKRADLMLHRGDDDGRLLWSRIRRAIEALRALRRGRLN
jgi:hypothetical protein